jgi:gamma-glutamylcyclotransferase (GGCT)/AIG2-like uncharacterized protein YtfP
LQTHCLLFVYGSLKRGQPNHHELGAARFVSPARTAPRYALRELAGYPALALGARSISGELFEIALADLSQLDEFEGENYVRQPIALADGTEAIAYVARDDAAGFHIDADEWPVPSAV